MVLLTRGKAGEYQVPRLEQDNSVDFLSQEYQFFCMYVLLNPNLPCFMPNRERNSIIGDFPQSKFFRSCRLLTTMIAGLKHQSSNDFSLKTGARRDKRTFPGLNDSNLFVVSIVR